MRLEAVDVSYSVGGATLVDGVTLAVQPGELLALVGPNGAGKSTLLALLSGQLRPRGGTVLLDGRDLRHWRPRELARARAVLAQENAVAFPFTVAQVVAMGREPWRAIADQATDDAAVAEAMRVADVAHLGGRTVPSLSGGERARVSFARVLAQDTPVVLLDEPTAALDLRHQEDVLGRARALADAGRSVAVVVHDLNLAAAYAHRVALMDGGAVVAQGTPESVFTVEALGRVYGLSVEVTLHEEGLHIWPVRHRP